MTEEHFRISLSAKVDASVRLVQVFKEEPLDFILFFSSMIMFEKDYGKSGYTSGCAFQDVFAHQLAQKFSCPVKVMNWGYWGDVGIGEAVPQAFKNRLAQAGVGNIEPQEAMKALETLAGPIDQVGLIKTIKPLDTEVIDFKEFITVYPSNFSTVISTAADVI